MAAGQKDTPLPRPAPATTTGTSSASATGASGSGPIASPIAPTHAAALPSGTAPAASSSPAPPGRGRGQAQPQQQEQQSSARQGRPYSQNSASSGGSENDDNASEAAVAADAAPTAYELEWGPYASCARRVLDIGAASSSGGVSGGVPSVDAVRRAWSCDRDTPALPTASPSGRLFILRDTNNASTNNIICSALGVDPAFLAAHTTHQRYQPRDRPWRGQINRASFAASFYVYPQVLTIFVAKTRAEFPVKVQVGPQAKAETASTPASTTIGAMSVAVGTTEKKATMSSAAPVFGDVYQSVESSDIGQGQRQDDKTPEATSSSATATASKSLSPQRAATEDEDGDTSVAVFCRASIWTGPRANVLLLDRSPSSTALEDALLDALDDAASSGIAVDLGSAVSPSAITVHDVISQLAYEQWLNFFDTLGYTGRARTNANRKLYWDMGQHLEQNLATSRVHEKRRLLLQRQFAHTKAKGPGEALHEEMQPFNDPFLVSSEDWQALLSRLGRIVVLLPLRQRKPLPMAAKRKTALPAAPDTAFTINGIVVGDVDGIATRSPEASGEDSGAASSPVADPSGTFSSTPQGQDALSRVTYMGGILLPFSIVAGIMSMSDPYGPGNSLFWIFWAITIPLTVVTLFIIYADDIRRVEVWKPMDDQSLQDAIKEGEAIPSSTVSALADAADAVVDKADSDTDSEIETEPVTGAVRRDNYRERHRTRVRVATDSGPDGPTYYRLSGPAESALETKPITAALRASTVRASGKPVVVEVENEQLQTGITSARQRRKFGIPNPFSRLFSSKTYQLPPPVVSDTAYSPHRRKAPVRGVDGPVLASPGGASGWPTIIVQQQPNGSHAMGWKRQRLGWYGAAKNIVGYEKLKRA